MEGEDDLGEIVSKVIDVLNRSKAFDRERWLSLNAAANALVDARSWEGYAAAQVAFKEVDARERSLFTARRYPNEVLPEPLRADLLDTLLAARDAYHAYNAQPDFYGLRD